MFSADGGRTLLVGDVLAAGGMGSAGCPAVAVTDDVPEQAALQRVIEDPSCFMFQELFPGGFPPLWIGTAADASLVGGLRGSTAGGFDWDLSGSVGVHRADFFSRNTINASLGPTSPNAFDIGTNRQRDVNVNFDVSYAVSDRVNVAAGAEWRDEQYGLRAGDRAGWEISPYAAQGFMGARTAPSPTAPRRRAPGE